MTHMTHCNADFHALWYTLTSIISQLSKAAWITRSSSLTSQLIKGTFMITSVGLLAAHCQRRALRGEKGCGAKAAGSVTWSVCIWSCSSSLAWRMKIRRRLARERWTPCFCVLMKLSTKHLHQPRDQSQLGKAPTAG